MQVWLNLYYGAIVISYGLIIKKEKHALPSFSIQNCWFEICMCKTTPTTVHLLTYLSLLKQVDRLIIIGQQFLLSDILVKPTPLYGLRKKNP